MSATDRSLCSSRWAPLSTKITSSDYRDLRNSISSPQLFTDTGRNSSVDKRESAQRQAYQKFLKSFRRLKWKSTVLVFCHHRALLHETNNLINNVNFPIFSDAGRANAAEIMFKADFFEFYALLERALVYLLECFGVMIQADYSTSSVPLPLAEKDLDRSKFSDATAIEHSIIGDSRAFHGYAHRFHANVLAALDRATNPLHPILGRGKVRQYLGIAKEFRNRWKEIELEIWDTQDRPADLHKSYHQILTELKLEDLLETVLSALEQAKVLVNENLAVGHASIEIDMVETDDEDAREDGMDWD